MRYDKLSPGLLSAFLDADAHAADRIGLRAGVMAIDMFPEEAVEPTARVFLRCDPTVSSDRWAGLGIVASKRRSSVRTATVPLSAVDQLSEDDTVYRIVAGLRLTPRLDVAASATGLPAFVSGHDLTGRGVVVGIVDTGIDSSHVAYAGRIRAIWDQTVTGPGVLEAPRGTEHLAPDLAGSVDTEGHGSHVAAIAAGDDGDFRGIAPEADIIAVRTTFNDPDILDGVEYVFRIAESMGCPAVVNLSLGGHHNAHDGTDPLSIGLNSFAGPGRIVCAAAGNEANEDIHAVLLVQEGTSASVDVVVPSPADVGVIRGAWVNAWYRPEDVIAFTLLTPGGESITAHGPVMVGDYTARLVANDGVVLISTPPPNPDNGDLNVVIELQPPLGGFSVQPGVWTVSCEGVGVSNGTVHLWAVSEHEIVSFEGQAVTNEMKVGSPGAAAEVVTVGAVTTRSSWTDANGVDQSYNYSPGQLAPFSSPGPLRTGGKKPDLAAPGSVLIAARSSQSSPPPEIQIDATHVAMQGTSMASPFIAGVIALLLQQDPTLGPDGAKAVLKAASQIPGSPTGATDDSWGAGIVDASKLQIGQ